MADFQESRALGIVSDVYELAIVFSHNIAVTFATISEKAPGRFFKQSADEPGDRKDDGRSSATIGRI